MDEGAQQRSDDRLSRGIRDRIQECVRSGLVEVIPEPGRMNAYRVLPIESPQYWLPSSLWWRGWLRHFDGAALAIYLHIVSSLSERPKRSGPPRIPRRYVRFDDIRTATVLTYPTIESGLNCLRHHGLVYEITLNRTRWILLVDPDLSGHPQDHSPTPAPDGGWG